jgi:hypothetical protein
MEKRPGQVKTESKQAKLKYPTTKQKPIPIQNQIQTEIKPKPKQTDKQANK